MGFRVRLEWGLGRMLWPRWWFSGGAYVSRGQCPTFGPVLESFAFLVGRCVGYFEAGRNGYLSGGGRHGDYWLSGPPTQAAGVPLFDSYDADRIALVADIRRDLQLDDAIQRINQSINTVGSESEAFCGDVSMSCSCTNELCFCTVSRERPVCIFGITRSKFNRFQWFLVHNITKIFYVREFDPVQHTCNVTTIPREMQILFIWLELHRGMLLK